MTTRVYIHLPDNSLRAYDLPEKVTVPSGHGCLAPGYEITLGDDTVIMSRKAKQMVKTLLDAASLEANLPVGEIYKLFSLWTLE